MRNRRLKLLVVDDHPIVILGIRALFAEDNRWKIIEARTASAAREVLKEESPDVSVIDINLSDGSGLELTRECVEQDPDAKIIVLSTNDAPMLAIQAIECGAKSYISKSANPQDLKDCVLAVAQGQLCFSNDLIQRMALLRVRTRAAMVLLSERELRILRMLAQGRSMAEIANDISVSYKSITSDCSILRAKLGARTSSGMIRIAVESKLI